ncbi:UDP-glucuronosyl and UDP-glucosyl transferase [Handroanthus impetiginosus]|uniref:UDP-glucuronosyl and UDP-glucosyl transferase n=1 Tax=Handroanthus impetiginosus TaxID=429701 RepID=A0A2G9G1U1_9LAMI|nr:UDP-glucuronosyl and UDP-glucosyl transferase [Handroanthus impetiginosus]
MAPKARKSLHIGHKISFVSTPRNIDRLRKLPPDLASSITLVKIPLPKLAELPENAEATMDVNVAQMDSLKKAFVGLETGLTPFLEDSRRDWVIQDFVSHWLPPIAARFGISRAFFWIMNAWFLAFAGPTIAIISGFDDRAKPEDFMVPPKWIKFETKRAYRRFEADWIVRASQNEESGFSDFYRGGKSFTIIKPVVPLGLMLPKVQEDEDHYEIWAPIKNWLDAQNKGSVVYVALGSEVILSQHQLTELAHGLELSGVPFFLVQWKPPGCIESDSMKLPDGFEDRVTGPGIVWRRWARQLKILSHESVGGFLTHCGCSSIVEGLMLGHPLLALPFLIDHGLTSRIIVEKQLGIEIPRDEQDGSFMRNSVANSIKLVMLEDDGKKL